MQYDGQDRMQSGLRGGRQELGVQGGVSAKGQEEFGEVTDQV